MHLRSVQMVEQSDYNDLLSNEQETRKGKEGSQRLPELHTWGSELMV